MTIWGAIAIVLLFLPVCIVLKLVFKRIDEEYQWRQQAYLRLHPPKAYELWISLMNGKRYYIGNSEPILISLYPDYRDAAVYTEKEWFQFVKDEKLIRYGG